jgi:chromosome segregation ATPase
MVDKTAIQYDLIFNSDAAAKDIASLTVQLKTANDQLSKMQKDFGGASTAVNRTGRAFGSAGQSIQNASYQVADFAVQLQGGVDVSRALGQQLPQLLAGFGVLGAAIGAGVAIFGPFITSLAQVRDTSAELEESTKALADAQETTRKSVEDLSEEYGKYGEVIRGIAETKERLAAADIASTLQADAKALSELNGMALGTASTFSIIADGFKNFDLRTTVIGQLIEPMNEFEKEVEKMQLNFGLTEEAAKALVGPVKDFGAALAESDVDGAAAALAEYNKWLQANIDSADEAIPLFDKMKEKFDALAKISTRNLASGFSFTPYTAANTFNNYEGNDRVRQQLEDIEEAARAAEAAQRDAEREASRRMREASAAAAKAASEYNQWVRTIERGTTPLEKANFELSEATAQFERFNAQMSPEQRDQATAYIENLQKKIDELQFKEKWDEMSKAVQSTSEPLNAFYEQIRDIGKSIQEDLASGITDAFMAFVEGTRSAEDAFKQFAVSFLKEITAMIVKATILYAIQTALGGTGGAFGALMQRFGGVYANGGAFGGGREIKAFANGGVVSSPMAFPMAGGKTGLMGEAGPEAIMPLTRRNGRLGVEGSPVNVRINNYTGAKVSAQRGADGSINIDVVEKELAARMARGGSPISKGLEAGYGLRRAGR